jgi:chemotaxis protein CheD
VGVALFDPGLPLAGLAHVMLPDSKSAARKKADTPFRYADTGVTALLAEMERLGAHRERIYARLIGGANMFVFAGKSSGLQPTIGERNLQAALASLVKAGIAMRGQDSGGNYGRSIEFDARDGFILVRTAQYGLRWLS